jgi:hypothetical protein
MKTNIKNHLTFLFVILMTGFSVVVSAQTMSSVTASAGATIIVPLTLTEQNALHFGSTSKPLGVGGAVILSTENASLDYVGGISGSSMGAPASNAVFSLSGASNYGYTITLPTTITIVGPEASSMIIDDLKIRFSNTAEEMAISQNNNSITKVLSTNGTDTFRLGGRLNVSADQIAGHYTGAYNVTVNYN